MTLYHGGASIPNGYGEAAAPTTVPAATFDWSAFGAGLTNVAQSGLEAYQSITAMQLAAKATLQAQKLQYQQALALAKAQGTTPPAPPVYYAPAAGAGAAAAATSPIDMTTLLLIGGLGLAAVYLLTRGK
jgi:hypothetical protein